MSNASLADAALVLSSEIRKIFEMGGSVAKKYPKSLGPAFSLCRPAGIDAALVKPNCLVAGAPPPSKIKLN